MGRDAMAGGSPQWDVKQLKAGLVTVAEKPASVTRARRAAPT